MERKKIVLVDTDEEYIAVLEHKLVEVWGDLADIEVITQLRYFHTYFSQPNEIFLLLINEILFNYEEKVQKQNITHLVLLTESESATRSRFAGKRNCQVIYKYSGVKELFARIESSVRITLSDLPVENTELILVHAVTGGCGKTLCALGICAELAKLGKKVLYISTESLQDFPYHLEEERWMDPDTAYAMSMNEAGVADDLPTARAAAGYEYMLPFQRLTQSYQIRPESWEYLIRNLKERNRYDMIIAELPVHAELPLLHLYDLAKKVVLICDQSERCAVRLSILQNSLTVPDDRYLLVCSRYDDNRSDGLRESEAAARCGVAAVVREYEYPLTREEMEEAQLMRAVAFIL